MKEPLVSIIIPSYCHEKYVKSCLKSVWLQTYKNIELIIFDDNSCDDTFNIVLQYKAKLEERFVRVICHRNSENIGVVKNENKMIELCKGKYIKSLASDDMLLPNAIEDLVCFYETYPEYDIIFSNGIYCGESEQYPLDSLKIRKLIYGEVLHLNENIMQQLYEDNFISAPTVLIRKDTFEKFGLYDEDFSIEDWEYWLRIAEKGRIGYCDKMTVAYRVGGESLSHFSNDLEGRERLKKMYDNQYKILDKYKESRKIDSYAGYEQFFNRFIHEAIDVNYSEFLTEIFRETKNKKIKLSLETKAKYIAYRLHILRTIQRVKRKLGFETVAEYKLN